MERQTEIDQMNHIQAIAEAEALARGLPDREVVRFAVAHARMIKLEI